MSACPYTWFKSLFPTRKNTSGEANELRVTVERGGVITVDVALPAKSARWLMELIPSDVIEKIRAEKIPIDEMQQDLARTEKLIPQDIFLLKETERSVRVWLE